MTKYPSIDCSKSHDAQMIKLFSNTNFAIRLVSWQTEYLRLIERMMQCYSHETEYDDLTAYNIANWQHEPYACYYETKLDQWHRVKLTIIQEHKEKKYELEFLDLGHKETFKKEPRLRILMKQFIEPHRFALNCTFQGAHQIEPSTDLCFAVKALENMVFKVRIEHINMQNVYEVSLSSDGVDLFQSLLGKGHLKKKEYNCDVSFTNSLHLRSESLINNSRTKMRIACDGESSWRNFVGCYLNEWKGSGNYFFNTTRLLSLSQAFDDNNIEMTVFIYNPKEQEKQMVIDAKKAERRFNHWHDQRLHDWLAPVLFYEQLTLPLFIDKAMKPSIRFVKCCDDLRKEMLAFVTQYNCHVVITDDNELIRCIGNNNLQSLKVYAGKTVTLKLDKKNRLLEFSATKLNVPYSEESCCDLIADISHLRGFANVPRIDTISIYFCRKHNYNYTADTFENKLKIMYSTLNLSPWLFQLITKGKVYLQPQIQSILAVKLYSKIRHHAYDFLNRFKKIKHQFGSNSIVEEIFYDGQLKTNIHELKNAEEYSCDLDHFWCARCTSQDERYNVFLNIVFESEHDRKVFADWDFEDKVLRKHIIPCVVLRYLYSKFELYDKELKAFIATILFSQQRTETWTNVEYDRDLVVISTLFLQGVEVLYFVNQVSGHPILECSFNIGTFFSYRKFEYFYNCFKKNTIHFLNENDLKQLDKYFHSITNGVIINNGNLHVSDDKVNNNIELQESQLIDMTPTYEVEQFEDIEHLPLGTKFKDGEHDAIVTYVKSCTHFYIRPVISIIPQDDFNAICENAPKLTNFHATTVCAVKLSNIYDDSKAAEKVWYRAKILISLPEASYVFLIDIGLSIMVSKDSLVKLSKKFDMYASVIDIELHDYEAIKGIEYGEIKKELTNRKVTACVANGIWCVPYLVTELLTQRIITVKGNDIQNDFAVIGNKSEEEMSFDGIYDVKRKKFEEGEIFNCFVSHVVSPVEFYISVADVENFYDKLMDISVNAPKLDKITVGTICSTKYSKDGNWYRARIVNIIDNLVDVYFVDYGNTERISKDDLVVLSKEFDIEELAVRMSLKHMSYDVNETDIVNRFWGLVKHQEYEGHWSRGNIEIPQLMKILIKSNLIQANEQIDSELDKPVDTLIQARALIDSELDKPVDTLIQARALIDSELDKPVGEYKHQQINKINSWCFTM